MLKEQFLLDPAVIFLNHGSFGACPRLVFEAYQAWQKKLEEQPVQFLGVELDDRLHHARQVLGKYVGAPVSDLVFIPNATHGVNIVSRSLNLSPGDEVLTSDQEYGACNFAWDFVCQKTGAIYKQQPIRTPITNPDEIIDQFWQGVTDRTKVIYTSHICSPTALSFPVGEICRRAREAGILTLIDGAHAPGQVQLNLSSLQADFYTGNCHKWMLAPKGAGFLYARPDVQNMLEPLVVSWGYQSKSSLPRESAFIDLFQWTGTRDPAAALSVPVAIAFMHEHQWEQVQLCCHELLKDTMQRISSLTGYPPLYPLASDLFYQMGTIPIPKVRDLNELKQGLLHEHHIEIPTIDWNNAHFLRLSVQGYNSTSDMDALINALAALLPVMLA
ncbi:MAG: aminotransferase [Anaerolineales bacterium]|nr:MAG: aminotransferase [Anaerolineales bacterium]